MRNLSFRQHAIIRIIKGDEEGIRTKLSVHEVRSIITNPDKVVPIGMEGKKKYVLFFSIKDDDYFIVVQDESTREVITLMSFSKYGDRVPITREALLEARRIADPDFSPHEVSTELNEQIKSLKSQKN